MFHILSGFRIFTQETRGCDEPHTSDEMVRIVALSAAALSFNQPVNQRQRNKGKGEMLLHCSRHPRSPSCGTMSRGGHGTPGLTTHGRNREKLLTSVKSRATTTLASDAGQLTLRSQDQDEVPTLPLPRAHSRVTAHPWDLLPLNWRDCLTANALPPPRC